MAHGESVDAKDGKFSRVAGILEQYHIARHAFGLDTCLILAVKYTNRIGISLNRETVFRALSSLLQHQPTLWLKINNDKSKQSFFSFLDTLDLNQVVTFVEDDSKELLSLAQKEFLKPFDANQQMPLWRLLVLADGMIIFEWHHGFGDGLSGLSFLHSFHKSLITLDSVSSDKEENTGILKLPSALKQMQPIEKVTDLSVSFRIVMSKLFELVFPMKCRQRYKWTGNAILHSPELTNNMRIIVVRPEDTERILTMARSYKATLTSTFYVLAISALSSVITGTSSSSKPHRYRSIPSAIPVSLRKISNLPQTSFGDLVSTIYINTPLIKVGFSWSLASEISATIRNSVPKSRQVIGMLKYLNGRYEDYFMDKLGSKRELGLEISNLGVFVPDIESNSESSINEGWKIEEMYFAQNDATLGAALKLNVVGSPNGSVSICLTWGKGAVDDEFAETFFQKFKTGIDELAKKQ